MVLDHPGSVCEVVVGLFGQVGVERLRDDAVMMYSSLLLPSVFCQSPKGDVLPHYLPDWTSPAGSSLPPTSTSLVVTPLEVGRSQEQEDGQAGEEVLQEDRQPHFMLRC